MRKQAQTVRVLAILIQRINIQIQGLGEPRVRHPHSGEDSEFKSNLLEEVCRWKRNVHTFTDKAHHQSNGLVAHKIGQ